MEVSYDYFLSLFVNYFNHSVSEFELLTPVQANRILYDKSLIDNSKLQFFQVEIRNVCFYAIKSSMGDTSRIRKPSDLYQLAFEEEQAREEFENYKAPSLEAIREIEALL